MILEDHIREKFIGWLTVCQGFCSVLRQLCWVLLSQVANHVHRVGGTFLLPNMANPRLTLLLLTWAFLAYQWQAHCREIYSTRSLVDTEWKPQMPNGRISPGQLYIECGHSPCDQIGVVNQSLPIQPLPVSVERCPTLSCWVQLPLLLRGMVTSTFARSRVMAGVTSITLARPSCITTAATSAFWVGSHACSKGLAPLGWLQHRKVAVSIKTSKRRFFCLPKTK